MKCIRNPLLGQTAVLGQSCELSPPPFASLQGPILTPGERKGERKAGQVCSEINRIGYEVSSIP